MDGEALRGAVEASKATELDRLGSERLLAVLAGGDPSPAAVLSAVAATEYAAAETFRGWADSEEDDRARGAFADVAAQEDEHFERVAAEVEGFEPPAFPGPMHAYLRGIDDTVRRAAAGLVGRPLVSLRSHARVIAFLDGRDDGRADRFRDLRAETADELALGVDLLDGLCGGDDWGRARAAAEYAVQVAYDDYADSLRERGVEPGESEGLR